MFERNPDHRDIFDEGYKSLQKGILLFGGQGDAGSNLAEAKR